jgi:hypothetical protein
MRRPRRAVVPQQLACVEGKDVVVGGRVRCRPDGCGVRGPEGWDVEVVELEPEPVTTTGFEAATHRGNRRRYAVSRSQESFRVNDESAVGGSDSSGAVPSRTSKRAADIHGASRLTSGERSSARPRHSATEPGWPPSHR